MVFVVTNSRRFATDKLMSKYGLSAPFKSVRFVESTTDLPAFSPTDALPFITIWQRGRLTTDLRLLREMTQEAEALGLIREPTPSDLET